MNQIMRAQNMTALSQPTKIQSEAEEVTQPAHSLSNIPIRTGIKAGGVDIFPGWWKDKDQGK